VYPEAPGGIGLHVHNLSEMQASRGHEVTVLTSDLGSRDLPDSESRSGYRIVRCSEVISPFDNSIAPGVVPGVLRRLGSCDLLHVHSHLHFVSNVAAILGWASRIPLLVTNHGLVSQTAPRWLRKLHFAAVGKHTFDAADRILCYTETDRARLETRGVSSSVHVVPNGIDCDQFQPDPTTAAARQLVFVGRLKRGKGVGYLLEGFADLHGQYPDLRLVLVGDGPLRDSLASRAEALGVRAGVEFTGYLPNRDVVDVYNESTVFVLPSLSEGLPRAMLEAMACELPVVTSDLPQLRPIIDEAGFTVPKRDPDAISSRVARLLDNPELRARMGREGRRRVREQYDWRDTVAATTCHCRELAERRRTDSGRPSACLSE
jgi:glycosyltransferase involved in cell wall biosynthesis